MELRTAQKELLRLEIIERETELDVSVCKEKKIRMSLMKFASNKMTKVRSQFETKIKSYFNLWD